MIISAIAIGLLCAYHFGSRAGVIASATTVVLLLAAIVMPGHALKIYLLVACGVGGICFVGPKVARDEARPVKRGMKLAFKTIRRFAKRLRK